MERKTLTGDARQRAGHGTTGRRPGLQVALFQIAAVFGLFIAGFFIGIGLASWAAPGSGLAAGVSGMLLPTSFAGGLIFWAGADVALVLGDIVRRLRRRPRDLAPRSARFFVPLAVALSGVGGLLVGLVPGGEGVMLTTIAYTFVGALYGWLIARLAARGWIPGPPQS